MRRDACRNAGLLRTRGLLLAGAIAAMCMQASSASAGAAAAPTPAHEKLARELEAAMNGRNAAAFDAAIDVPSLKEAIIAGDADRAFWAQALVGLPGKLKLGEMIVQRMGKRGAYRFLRFTHRDGRIAALFRLNGPAGLNYHELILSVGADGRARIADMYVMVSGELLSQTIRRTVRMAADEGKGRELAEAMDNARAMKTHLAAGRSAAALAAYRTLPRWLQDEKWVQILRLEAAGRAGRKEYDEAAADFRRRFGDDPAADLSAAVVYDTQKQYDRALEAIVRLDRRIGGDAYLDFMRGLTVAAGGDAQQGRAILHAALEREPTLYEAYEVLIRLAMRQNDPDAAVEVLERAARSGVAVEVESEPALAELARTPQYARWKQRQTGQDIH